MRMHSENFGSSEGKEEEAGKERKSRPGCHR
jgi:hypothetical protein